MKVLIGICLVFFTMVGPSAGSSPPTAKENPLSSSGMPASSAIQPEFEKLSSSAKEIFDLAKETKWYKIKKKLDKLKKSEASIQQIKNGETDFYLLQLRSRIDELEEAIRTENKKDTMRYANDITLLEVAMSGELKLGVPTNVMLLGYCGRKLEVLSQEKDNKNLSNLVIRMHLIWQNLIPKLAEKGETREIKAFSDIMKRLEKAKTFEEYSHLSENVLDEVDAIEKVFRKR